MPQRGRKGKARRMPREIELTRQNWHLLSPAKRRQLLRNEGYFDLTVEVIDCSKWPPQLSDYTYTFLEPRVNTEAFKENLNYLTEALLGRRRPAGAPRKGCPADARPPSLSKEKQLNRNPNSPTK